MCIFDSIINCSQRKESLLFLHCYEQHPNNTGSTVLKLATDNMDTVQEDKTHNKQHIYTYIYLKDLLFTTVKVFEVGDTIA